MTERDRMEERLLRAGLPNPPADLRERVLAAAEPIARETETATWTDRVWFSRRWRLAAVAALVALVALDRVSAVPRASAPDGHGAAAVESARVADEVARQAGLSPKDANALARRVLMAASRPAPQPQDMAALGLRP